MIVTRELLQEIVLAVAIKDELETLNNRREATARKYGEIQARLCGIVGEERVEVVVPIPNPPAVDHDLQPSVTRSAYRVVVSKRGFSIDLTEIAK
jgi:hypothetical protein